MHTLLESLCCAAAPLKECVSGSLVRRGFVAVEVGKAKSTRIEAERSERIGRVEHHPSLIPSPERRETVNALTKV